MQLSLWVCCPGGAQRQHPPKELSCSMPNGSAKNAHKKKICSWRVWKQKIGSWRLIKIFIDVLKEPNNLHHWSFNKTTADYLEKWTQFFNEGYCIKCWIWARLQWYHCLIWFVSELCSATIQTLLLYITYISSLPLGGWEVLKNCNKIWFVLCLNVGKMLKQGK